MNSQGVVQRGKCIMKIVRCTEKHLDNFKPSKSDLEEAKEAGIEPHIVPDDNTVALLDESGRVLLVGGHERYINPSYMQTWCKVWFVTSELVESLGIHDKITLVKALREYRDELKGMYDVLFNYVYVNNETHVRLLKALGAKFPDGYSQVGDFRMFVM